jgi:voltage-gated potassium channel Kch
VTARRRNSANATTLRMSAVVSVVAAAAVVLGGTAAWLTERNAPGRTFGSWGDSVWWALTTLTTVGYGDHVPVTPGGRMVGGLVMVVGVAVLGGVAAVVALAVAHAVASAEEKTLELEAEAVERRIEGRLDELDLRLARIEEQLRSLADVTSKLRR